MNNSNSIDAIQKQYTFAVEPVQFFEPRKAQASVQIRKDPFDFLNQMSQKGFNPFHPNVKSETMAKHLDILS